MPKLEQVAYATTAKYEARAATVTFDRPTKPGNLIVVVESAAGALPVGLDGPAGFTRAGGDGLRDIEAASWYRFNAPATTQITAGYKPLTMRSIQLYAFEVSGVAQANALDKVLVRSGENTAPYTGVLTPSQADSALFGFVINQYDTPTQGFAGNLAKLYERVSPQSWARGTNVDWERSRINVFFSIPGVIAAFSLLGRLAVARRWITILLCFKGGTIGPVKLSSTTAAAGMTSGGGTGALTVFGKFSSTLAPPGLTTDGVAAQVGPFDYQFRVGGYAGLLLGSGTDYHVTGTKGLFGWTVRQSDDDLPREAGAVRGVDLQSARNFSIDVAVSGLPDNTGDVAADVERNVAALRRALVPRRDEDFPLLFRRPTEPLKLIYCRPADFSRETGRRQHSSSDQTVLLRAADPRHYAAAPTRVRIPVTPGVGEPTIAQVFNRGNAPAYPTITIWGPTSGPPVERIELVNITALVTFGVSLTLPKGSILVGDMPAVITAAGRSKVTLDGGGKYGAWDLPRDTFRIEPDPDGMGGYNEVYLRTEPAGAPITCELIFRDTWAG